VSQQLIVAVQPIQLQDRGWMTRFEMVSISEKVAAASVCCGIYKSDEK
jgi:hypothetical protein